MNWMKLAVAGGLLAAGAAWAAENPLPSPGFEGDNAKWWAIGDDSSQFVAEAAHSGSLGLRIGSLAYNPMGASVSSAKLPVAAGQEFTVTFWAKGTPDCCGVYLWFANEKGKNISEAGAKQQMCGVNQKTEGWNQYTLHGRAPTNAATVSLWIHSFSGSAGLIDLDDFAVSGLAADAAAVPPAPPRKARAKQADKPVVLPARKAPPMIIIKLDDVKQVHNSAHASWKKMAEFFQERRLKAGFGVICQTLEEAKPEYVQWLKQVHDAGWVEFWFHGWDHGTHSVNGAALKEFNQRPYAEQKERFDKSQKLALEKLGFAFTTFGPPGGGTGASFDDNTCSVMQDDPHMKAWLYPQPLDEAGKKLEAAGKVMILDRVWEVNLESAVGVPDFNKFVQGYAAHPEREYFVLQGHPAMWGDGARFAEFVKIIDFLVAQKAVFMTPAEFVAQKQRRN
jgi:peptidoglycan/xylan/chitin deacetylase (PgdA/CDA1 family)